MANAEEEEEEKEEEKTSPAGRFGNAFGGLGGGLLGQAVDRATSVVEGSDAFPVGWEDCGFVVGSQVVISTSFGPIEGEVISLLPEMSGCSAIVKYVFNGEQVTSRVDVSRLTLRMPDEVFRE